MAGSPNFKRIKTEVLGIVRDIPRGHLSTFAQIGHELEVVPRHVAYILAMLTDDERKTLPWHRVLSATGTINQSKHGRGEEQAHLLSLEGHEIGKSGKVVCYEKYLWGSDGLIRDDV
jgi:methylated-DNA-protein-cysteine methyltransferase-like protein